jgi:hypothetical protein
MKGCQTAFFMWLPILIGKLIKGILLFIKWLLQTISGVPLHYCKPEYRIPAQIVGTIGLFFSFFFIIGVFMLISDSSQFKGQGNPLLSFLILGGVGFGLLMVCRILIRRGSV